MVSKVECTIMDVAINTTFYIKRFPDGCSADSIDLVKVDEQTANSFEWGSCNIDPDQPCWFFS